MATWAFEEDFIVCAYYLDHIDDWRQHLDELIEQLAERGYDRDKTSAIMRVQNFQYIKTSGKHGLKNGTNQSKRIYEAFDRFAANPTLKSNIKAHIQNTYTGVTALDQKVRFDEDQLLSPLDINLLNPVQQQLHNMIFVLPKEPTFKDILFGFIKQKGFEKHSEVYNACQVKRDTFNAIKQGKNYGVSKRTVLQLCFGLKLTYDESVVLMSSAGYAFARNNLTDVIAEYYLKQEYYDIFEVNASMYESGADLLFQ